MPECSSSCTLKIVKADRITRSAGCSHSSPLVSTKVTPVARLPDASRLMLRHLAIVARREIRFADAAPAGSSSAGWPWSSCRSRTIRRSRNRCMAPAHAERIGVGLRQIARRLRKRLVAQLPRGLGEQRVAEAPASAPAWIGPRARPFERVAALLNLALEIAGGAARCRRDIRTGRNVARARRR